LAREHNARAWLAWHAAKLGQSNPKKFPKLKSLEVAVGGSAKRRQRQTPEQMLMVAKLMAGMSFPEITKPKG
jgi:hypothetical protein